MTNLPVLNVIDQGTGPPLLFVHGWLNDSSVWSGVMTELARDFRCIAFDHRGHGLSEAPGAGNYTRDMVLGDMGRILDERSIESAVVVGHSLGGYLALAMAIEAPGRVGGLGLVAAGPGFRNPQAREQWNESVRATAAGRDLPDGMEAISMHVDSMVIDRLHEIDLPACVIVGERDHRFLASASLFAKHLDVRANVVVPETGHMVHAKAPAVVAQHLREVFGESSTPR